MSRSCKSLYLCSDSSIEKVREIQTTRKNRISKGLHFQVSVASPGVSRDMGGWPPVAEGSHLLWLKRNFKPQSCSFKELNSANALNECGSGFPSSVCRQECSSSWRPMAFLRFRDDSIVIMGSHFQPTELQPLREYGLECEACADLLRTDGAQTQ